MPRDLQALATKQAAFRADANDPRHGTANGYQALACRCQRCRQAQTVAMREYREQRR